MWLYRQFFPPEDPMYTMGYEILLQENEVGGENEVPSEKTNGAGAGDDKLSQDP
jgi:hypothetical protein